MSFTLLSLACSYIFFIFFIFAAFFQYPIKMMMMMMMMSNEKEKNSEVALKIIISTNVAVAKRLIHITKRVN